MTLDFTSCNHIKEEKEQLKNIPFVLLNMNIKLLYSWTGKLGWDSQKHGMDLLNFLLQMMIFPVYCKTKTNNTESNSIFELFLNFWSFREKKRSVSADACFLVWGGLGLFVHAQVSQLIGFPGGHIVWSHLFYVHKEGLEIVQDLTRFNEKGRCEFAVCTLGKKKNKKYLIWGQKSLLSGNSYLNISRVP